MIDVELKLPTREDVVAAASRIKGLVERTPLIESEVAGERVWFKATACRPAARSN